jgi:Tfp pilus assembly protein PilF
VCQIASAVFAAFLLVACAGGRETTRKDAVASYKLGIAYLTEGRIAPALQELSKAEALNPANPEVLNALGFAYWMRKEHFLAEEKFRKAVALKPDYSEAWNNLAAMFIEQGRYGEAVGPAEQALKNVYYGTQERALANSACDRRSRSRRPSRSREETSRSFWPSAATIGEPSSSSTPRCASQETTRTST